MSQLVLTDIITELGLSYPSTDNLPKPEGTILLAKITQYNLKDEHGNRIEDEFGVIQYSTMMSASQDFLGMTVTANSWLTGGKEETRKVYRISLGQNLEKDQLVSALKLSKENLYCYIDIADPKHPVAMTVAQYRHMRKTGDTGEIVESTVDGTPIPELEKTGDSPYPV